MRQKTRRKAEQRSLLSPSVGSCDALHIKVIALSCCGWRPLTTRQAHSRAATQLTTLSPIDGANHVDLIFHVVLLHDAGWAEFDRDPVTDRATGLPYNLVETPAEYIAVTSRGSPEFNQRQHPFCG